MTALEWFMEQLKEIHTQRKWEEIIEQALEMEKQQIINAWNDGSNTYSGIGDSETYYNEKIKTE